MHMMGRIKTVFLKFDFKKRKNLLLCTHIAVYHSENQNVFYLLYQQIVARP